MRFLLLCFAAYWFGTAVAQDLPPPDPDAPIRLMKPDHMMIGVVDMNDMVEWYTDKLDFVVEKSWTVDGLDGIGLAYLVGQGFRLEFIEGGSGEPVDDPATFNDHFQRRGFQHLAFDVADLDATVATLERRGVRIFVPPTDYPIGAARRVAFIKDPEGNVIEITGPLSQPENDE